MEQSDSRLGYHFLYKTFAPYFDSQQLSVYLPLPQIHGEISRYSYGKTGDFSVQFYPAHGTFLRQHTLVVRERTGGMQNVTFLTCSRPCFWQGRTRHSRVARPFVSRPYALLVSCTGGGIVGTARKGLKKVIEAEAAVFGATDVGSAVQIRVSGTSAKIEEFKKESRGREDVTGRDYLFWSMARSGSVEKGNPKPARWYFPSGTSFQVTLSARGTDITGLKQAIAAFWLLTQLGGIGSRSRRCAGSLAVQTVENNITPLSFNVPENAQALKIQLEQGIRDVKQIAKELHKLESTLDHAGPIRYSDTGSVSHLDTPG